MPGWGLGPATPRSWTLFNVARPRRAGSFLGIGPQGAFVLRLGLWKSLIHQHGEGQVIAGLTL
jgi:hypothetical protein